MVVDVVVIVVILIIVASVADAVTSREFKQKRWPAIGSVSAPDGGVEDSWLGVIVCGLLASACPL